MKLTDCFYLARKDLSNFKLRSSLIIACISVGILSSTLNLYYTSRRVDDLTSSFADMGSELLYISIQAENISIKDISFLSSYFPIVSYEAISVPQKIKHLRKNKGVNVIGIVPDYQFIHPVEIEKGRFLSSGDVKKNRKVCVVEKGLAGELKIRVGENVLVGGANLRVIGLYCRKELNQNTERGFLIPISIYQEVIGELKNICVIIPDKGEIKILHKQVENMLEKKFPDKKKREGFSVSRAEGLLQIIEKQKFIGKMTILGIGITTLILAGSGIINTIMLTIRHRYKEIGIMRACGAKADDVLYLFMIEGFLLSLTGLFIGVFLSGFYVWISSEGRFDILLEVLPWSSFLCLVISLCGYYPAQLAAKISPCEAIREGIKV